mmetsp:Transcript_35652/g.79200  ORF Transcript_35652/g.79200 Transcript_35652/m.79200 type:complete len:245 (+) Transcript_35652:335-1069(+)
MSSVATSFGRYWGASLVHSTRYSGLCRTVVRSSDEQTRLFWQATLRSGSSMMALAISQNMRLSICVMKAAAEVRNMSSGSLQAAFSFTQSCTHRGSDTSPMIGEGRSRAIWDWGNLDPEVDTEVTEVAEEMGGAGGDSTEGLYTMLCMAACLPSPLLSESNATRNLEYPMLDMQSMHTPVTIVGSGLVPLRNRATRMPASTEGLVRQWCCSISETSLFICASICPAYSSIRSSMLQFTLRRAQQ